MARGEEGGEKGRGGEEEEDEVVKKGEFREGKKWARVVKRRKKGR